MVTPMDLKAVDPYLTAGGTILRPSGDVATEAAHAAHGLVRQHARRRWIVIGAASTVAIATAGAAIALWPGNGSSASDANGRITTDAGAADADAGAKPLPSLDSVFELRCQCDVGSVFCGAFVVANGAAVTHERCTHCPGSTAACAYTIGGALSRCRPEVDPGPLDPISGAALIRLRGCATPDPLSFAVSSLRPGAELRSFGWVNGELAPVRVRLEVDAEGQLRAKSTQGADEDALGGPFIDDRHRIVGVVTDLESRTGVLVGNDATVLRDALSSRGITVRSSP
jgi:hypothetical protein